MAQIIEIPDPETLSKLLENLKLENDLPELSGTLNILEELNAADEINDTEESVPVKQEPCDDIEKTSSSQLAAEDVAIALKSEDVDELCIIKSEVFSDDEEEEDNSTVLLERGGPDRNKKRNNKRKSYDKKYLISNAELDKHKLKFSSGGEIIQNNSAFSSLQSSHVQYFVPSSNILSYNIPVQYQGINSLENHEINNDATNSNYSASSPDIGFINSPESGYDTSHSSGVYSPSPPSAEFQLLSEELEKKIAIETIVNSFLEIERDYKNSKTLSTKGNFSIVNDANSANFNEKLLMTQNLSSIESSGELSHEIVDFANSYCNSFPNDINDNFSVQNLEYENQLNNFEEIVKFVDNSTNIQTAVSQPPLAPVTSTYDNEHKLKKNSKERKISIELKEVEKYHLRFSEFFVENNYHEEEKELLRNIKDKQLNKIGFNVIDIVQENEESLTKPNVVVHNQTNLQKAVIQQNIEKIYCLVEAHKKFCSNLSMMINHKDDLKKTSLDYAVEMNYCCELKELVVNYLIENLAVRGISLD